MWILSRKGNVSFTPSFQTLPGKMARMFNSNSVVFVYPETHAIDGVADDFTSAAEATLLGKGINLLKGAKDIFQKSSERSENTDDSKS